METFRLEKKCQFCGEAILIEADVCKHCHRNQIDDKKIDEIIKGLSNNNKLNIFPVFLFLIAYPTRLWWLIIASLLLPLIREYTIKEELKKISKLTLIEKYEKYLKSKLLYDIIYYILVVIGVLEVIGYYSENGHL